MVYTARFKRHLNFLNLHLKFIWVHALCIQHQKLGKVGCYLWVCLRMGQKTPEYWAGPFGNYAKGQEAARCGKPKPQSMRELDINLALSKPK